MDKSVDSQAVLSSLAGDDHEEVRKLIELAKTDRDAIAQLYRIHHRAVAAYVHRRVSNVEDANDVIAEVFTEMVKELPKFRWRGVPFHFWLYRIATYKISRWARQRRSVVLDQLEEPQAISTAVSEHIDAEFIAMALESLPIKLQDVLSLHSFGVLRPEHGHLLHDPNVD